MKKHLVTIVTLLAVVVSVYAGQIIKELQLEGANTLKTGASLTAVAGSTVDLDEATVTLPADVTRLGSSISLTSEVAGVLPSANGGAGTVNGIVKANGSGLTSAAVAGTDYFAPGDVSAAEFGYLDGVTSAIQTQINSKQAAHAILTALSGLSLSSGNVIYATGATTLDVASSTSYGRSLLNAADAAALRTLSGSVIGTNVQAWDSDLDSIAGLTTTSFGRGFLDLADAAAARTKIGTVIGTNVQAWDADLDDLADGTLTGSKVQPASDSAAGVVTTGTQEFAGNKNFEGVVFIGGSAITLNPFDGDVNAVTFNDLTVIAGAGATLNIAAGKTLTVSNTLTLAGTDGSTLNYGGGGTLGSAAFVNTGTSGAVVPLLNGNNTHGGTSTFTGNVTMNGTSNTAPNQTAASSSSIMTRGLGDTRYGGLKYTAYKSSSTTRVSDATLSDDPHLVLSGVETGFYRVEFFGRFFTSSATPGLKLKLNLGSGTSASNPRGMTIKSGAAVAANSNILSELTYTDNGVIVVTIEGWLDVTSTASLAVQWSQNTSSVDSTLLSGGWLILTKLN